MAKNNFHKYLNNLGFSEKEISVSLCENVFCYSPHPKVPSVKYILVSTETDIFNYHLKLWNQNSDSVFIAVNEKKSYIIDLKKKPNKISVLKSSVCIQSFDYGINSLDFRNVDIEVISKTSIDSTFFFQFIQQHQKKKQEVDKDLLLNLIALRNDLIESDNEQIIHLLILRCLFVKYLEDRGIFSPDFLPDILRSKSPWKLLDAFDEVCKINGDVFGKNKLTANDIKIEYLDKLNLFFTTDYQSGQGSLFPYQFDNIPIQLISHVYEAFLKNETKKGKGIYYTPSFVVNFMLSQSLKEIAKDQPHMTVLDPAVGSGAFLVESFKILRDALSRKLKRKLDFDEKKQILVNQLWGIDVDIDALQITAFSLYLALLEDESPEFIRHEIEHSNPILPGLIGRTLMNANTIVDTVFENEKFDFIISNPPWGSVPTDLDNEENNLERNAIDNKNGNYYEYDNVADYERSQAFLRRVVRWQKDDTLIVMIVKNSIFLNDKTKNFRREFLDKNKIETFYELSHYNKILFRKRLIGKIRGKEPVEIGASEPCAIVFFRPNKLRTDYTINYISPKLTKLGEHFELIQYTSNESFHVGKSLFLKHDELWRVLCKSDFEGYNLLEKLREQKDYKLTIKCSKGIEPKINTNNTDDVRLVELIKSENISAFKILNNNKLLFNINQKLRRPGNKDLFFGERILIANRPKPSDKYRLRSIFVQNELYFRNDIFGFRVDNAKNQKPYVALLNSSLFGFYLYNLSAQWFGGAKRDSLRKSEISELPFINFNNYPNSCNSLIELVDKLINNYSINTLKELDEFVYNIYNLTEYEKEIINEFYQVNVDRAEEKLQIVQQKDIIQYFKTFKETFSLLLSPEYSLNASYNISQNIGAIIKIAIEGKKAEKEIAPDNTLRVLQFVKNKQLTETDKLLKEEKIKIYESKHFYLIKSNQFKDWTIRQAYKDAKEEIGLIIANLPNTNE